MAEGAGAAVVEVSVRVGRRFAREVTSAPVEGASLRAGRLRPV